MGTKAREPKQWEPLLHELQHILLRHTLITIYKAFICPYLDYGDILYDKALNASFHQKIESIQYNACLTITDAVRGSSREKFIKSWIWNHSNIDSGIKNYFNFIKYIMRSHQSFPINNP